MLYDLEEEDEVSDRDRRMTNPFADDEDLPGSVTTIRNCDENGNRRNRRYNYQLLIELVKKNPAIFDNKHEMYRNRIYIQNIWQNIAKEMGCSDKMCREKWANLRSNYMREMRKLKLKQLEGSPFRITWTYFNAMSFLNTYFVKSSTDSNGMNSPDSPHEDDERLVIDLSHDHQLPPSYEFQSSTSSWHLRNYDAAERRHDSRSPTSVAEDAASNKSVVSSSSNEMDDPFDTTNNSLLLLNNNNTVVTANSTTSTTTSGVAGHYRTIPNSAVVAIATNTNTFTTNTSAPIANNFDRQSSSSSSSTSRKRKLLLEGSNGCGCCSSDRTHLEDIVQSLKSIAENSFLSDATNSDSSDKLFLLSLLPSMRRLSSDDNLSFRVETQQILNKRLRNADKKMKRRQPEFRYSAIRNYTAANGKVLKDFRRSPSS